MANSQEGPFPYWKTVYSLKQFLLEKKRRIDSEISDGIILNVNKAEDYFIKISDILDSKYFKYPNTSLTVKELMVLLKKEDAILKEEIEKVKELLKSEEEALANFSESKAHREFLIPDEEEIYLSANRQHANQKIATIREELKSYEYRLRICRDLKGIICRPNGFFNTVWK